MTARTTRKSIVSFAYFTLAGRKEHTVNVVGEGQRGRKNAFHHSQSAREEIIQLRSPRRGGQERERTRQTADSKQ